jgi:hypothetical protein
MRLVYTNKQKQNLQWLITQPSHMMEAKARMKRVTNDDAT